VAEKEVCRLEISGGQLLSAVALSMSANWLIKQNIQLHRLASVIYPFFQTGCNVTGKLDACRCLYFVFRPQFEAGYVDSFPVFVIFNLKYGIL